ncbi:hemerythrin family protein [Candidatus Pacearchaeota archaeon]|nr:hemerythrin family protein [Candidatus Pacearchaeota archaeon]
MIVVFIKWSESVSVHVEEIDNQHKKLLGLINWAHDIDWDKDKEKGNRILNELIEFARVHFTTEENYFAKCNYGGAEAHVAAHMGYIAKVLLLYRNFQNGTCSADDVLNFLKSWWEDHLIKMDHKYVENFRACGLK